MKSCRSSEEGIMCKHGRRTDIEEERELGVHVSGHHDRTIEECTHCKRPACTTCPINEVEDDKRGQEKLVHRT